MTEKDTTWYTVPDFPPDLFGPFLNELTEKGFQETEHSNALGTQYMLWRHQNGSEVFIAINAAVIAVSVDFPVGPILRDQQ